MRKYLILVFAIVIFAIVHEGSHATAALAFNEFQTFHIQLYGLEVEFKTPINEREGVKWGLISGGANVATLLLGYFMFLLRLRISRSRSSFLRNLGCWLILCFLLLDAFNLSIGPFIYGGDINGIVAGFGINRYLVQILSFIILLVNRELIVHKLFPAYGVKTKHPLFKPLIKKGLIYH